MEFIATLKLPCKEPRIVADAISYGKQETTEHLIKQSSTSISIKENTLVVEIFSKNAESLSKNITSFMSKFKLSVDAVDMCEESIGSNISQFTGKE